MKVYYQINIKTPHIIRFYSAYISLESLCLVRLDITVISMDLDQKLSYQSFNELNLGIIEEEYTLVWGIKL